eukprot:CAMPEP_0197657694 /NCGR_PEP_ID=MMETSP1338-20131121/44787_1 /TAXON_ID=43686 ORGANISM="Pelagodinium beii, Strain RCC1491" /NCGR_SAMPLE_ID=MMETSP1338 /ASSEMBLY_ACC=CAM_ASM_000754 /LENGTH=198 /DNA_ID=CAMNT_0043234127 /DNA_START=46 /DNA_END=642 /DNA_ORIENTATION=+
MAFFYGAILFLSPYLSSGLEVTVDAAAVMRKAKRHEATLASQAKMHPFPTTDETCDGSNVDCPADGSDPCAISASCVGVYHSCNFPADAAKPSPWGSYFRQCQNISNRCVTGASQRTCYMKCPDNFIETVTLETGNVAAATCGELKNGTCNGAYVRKAGSRTLGMTCRLKDQHVCIDESLCAIQEPPDTFPDENATKK